MFILLIVYKCDVSALQVFYPESTNIHTLGFFFTKKSRNRNQCAAICIMLFNDEYFINGGKSYAFTHFDSCADLASTIFFTTSHVSYFCFNGHSSSFLLDHLGPCHINAIFANFDASQSLDIISAELSSLRT